MDVITSNHKTTFQANMELALQQLRSKYEGSFTYVSGLKGRTAQFVEIYGPTAAVANLGRKADTPDIDSLVEAIWMSPTQIAWGRLMEIEDAIKNVMDPSSQFIKAGAAAMVRGADKVRRDAIFGPRKIGQDGAQTSNWNGDTVADTVGSSNGSTQVGMNVAKIIRARRYMQARQVDIDMEQLTLQTNALGMEELYNDITFVSKDYREKSVVEGKQVRSILDVNIEVVDGETALADYDGSTHTAAMWAKSGLYWGEFSPLRTDMPLRADKMNRPHPQMEHWISASRTEDYKVVKILNHHS